MATNGNVPASWGEARKLGQLFMMGFDGTTVNDQIRTLITTYYIGSILLTAKNLESASQATQLILDLQTLAKESGHPVPLLIVIDQENGGVNSLYDEAHIRQFPSAMAIAATGDKQMARKIARATAEELKSCGVNWILGPVLDVLTNARNQPLGVRSFGEDVSTVSAFGVEAIKGFQEGGIATCGKHFPSYGNLEFFGAPTDVPTITDSLENLSQNALVPFSHAISANIDAMMVGGVAMSSDHLNVMHACLSEQVCRDLLRTEMKFSGVVVSECLEMEALSRNIGISGGTVMAFKAGCDLLLICRSISAQEEAINGLTAGLENGMLERSRVRESCERILTLKRKFTSWEKAFSPPGLENLNRLRLTNTNLSSSAYKSSVTVVRDRHQYLPLSKVLLPEDEILLLTPLVKPLPASAAFKQFTEETRERSLSPRPNYATDNSVMTGERVFRNFGRYLARRRNGRVMHTSYTANGVRPQHEALLERAKAVIVITADAGRNKYQAAFAKHISMLCRLAEDAEGRPAQKPYIVAAVSSPFDFATDTSIGTYLCSYDFTETALQSLVRVLYEGQTQSTALPDPSVRVRRPSQVRQHWLVEGYRNDRDKDALNTLLAAARAPSRPSSSLLKYASAETFLLANDLIEESHFVVRNSSTGELIGFCATYYLRQDKVGHIGAIIVSPSRRHQSVGHSLHDRAIRALLQKEGATTIKLGSRFPNVFPGVPSTDAAEHRKLTHWFAKLGWKASHPISTIHRMAISDLSNWDAPEGLGQSLAVTNIKYDLVHGEEYADSVLKHVQANAGTDVSAMYTLALSNKEDCAIIRGKRISDGSIVASVLLYRNQSTLATFIPQVQDTKIVTGGIGSAVMAASLENKASLLQGLILLGARQLKKQGVKSLLLDYVDDPLGLSGLKLMGFNESQTFEELGSSIDDWDAG